MIDLWDGQTFDPELNAFLKKNADLIRNHVATDHDIFLTYDHAPRNPSSGLRPDNPYGDAYLQLQDDVATAMQSRTIRAFHYTRLIDNEVKAFRREGIHLSTLVTFRNRLDACVAEGKLSCLEADTLYKSSPLHTQTDIRANRFWLTSHPIMIGDSSVEPLLEHWGGEATSMWLEDNNLIAKIRAIGAPCIIEVAVPINSTTANYNVAGSILATFARMLGCLTSKHAIDICANSALPPDAILAIHMDGQATFSAIGRTYPAGFIDVDLTYWKDLTGEDD